MKASFKEGYFLEKEEEMIILNTCLLAGKIMAESGSEAYRVEDTMHRIATNAGHPENVSYATATGLFMSLKTSSNSQIEQIKERAIDLEKVDAVNRLSRQFEHKEITLAELYEHLQLIEKDFPAFPKSWRILAAGFISAALMILFGGTWGDFIPAFIIGALGYTASLYAISWLEVHFLNEMAAAFLIGSLSFLAVKFGLASNMDKLIIGAVMPLVPGVAITTSFRDILAGHLISGMARGVEAIFTAAAIGVGIALVFKFFTFGG